MKKYIGWIAVAVSLVIIIVAASVLYDKLGSSYGSENDGLTTLPKPIERPSESNAESKAESNIESKVESSGTPKPESNVESNSQTVDESSSKPESSEQKPFNSPDFKIVDINGNSVKLSDYMGKPIILNFWASWCPPCKAEMPDFESKYKEYGNEIHFLMVNVGDASLNDAKKFIATSGYTFPVFYDQWQEASYAYGAESIPATYFFDSDGNIVAYRVGMLSASMLQQGIDMILD